MTERRCKEAFREIEIASFDVSEMIDDVYLLDKPL